MERELTIKQEKFCIARAMGKSWADSYREAYEPSNPKAPSIYTRAHRTRQNPLVVQRIAELRGQWKPILALDALYQQLLFMGLDLVKTAEDDKTRLGALQWVGGVVEKIRKLKEEVEKLEVAKNADGREPAEERAEIIAELRDLYAKAFPRKAEASVGEGEEEEPVEESEKEEERKLEETLAAGDGDVAESAAEFLEEISAVEAEVPEPPAAQVRYVEKCVSKPGHFPPRFVRIAVRPAPDAT
jgi:hypothetical protein